MNEEQQIADLLFSEWYHYVFLLIWIIILFVGIKYYPLLEQRFKLKKSFSSGSAYGKNLLISSFSLGLLLVVVFTFKPANPSETAINYGLYFKYAFYAIFIFLLLFNTIVSVQHYEQQSGLIRMVILSLLMIIYFYSGMLGGMILFVIMAIIILIIAFIKLRKILRLK